MPTPTHLVPPMQQRRASACLHLECELQERTFGVTTILASFLRSAPELAVANVLHCSSNDARSFSFFAVRDRDVIDGVLDGFSENEEVELKAADGIIAHANNVPSFRSL